MDKVRLSFPDPSQFKDEHEFNYAAMTASVFKKVLMEWIGWLESHIDAKKAYEAKDKGEKTLTDKFNIGGE